MDALPPAGYVAAIERYYLHLSRFQAGTLRPPQDRTSYGCVGGGFGYGGFRLATGGCGAAKASTHGEAAYAMNLSGQSTFVNESHGAGARFSGGSVVSPSQTLLERDFDTHVCRRNLKPPTTR